jgi:hypothetical protein
MSKIIIYKTDDVKMEIDVKLKDETIWLSQKHNIKLNKFLIGSLKFLSGILRYTFISKIKENYA